MICRPSLVRWIPAAAIIIGALAAGFLLLGDEDDPDPVAIASSAETFQSLDELVAASDIVVVATVTGIESGRTITSPSDPGAGIRTRLVGLQITQPLRGEPPAHLVVEEAASFTDDTPIAVDGMDELPKGQQAVWFLVTGGNDDMPYFATVNGQARYHVLGDTLDPAGHDALSRELAALGADELIESIIALG